MPISAELEAQAIWDNHIRSYNRKAANSRSQATSDYDRVLWLGPIPISVVMVTMA
jgi:hypothetical protein